jgi:Mn-dependent DtxR family transcriptional regulator
LRVILEAAKFSIVVDEQTITAAVEDYAKGIDELEVRDGRAQTSALAERLGVTPASASGMVKRLAGMGLVSYSRYRGARLTAKGRRVALEVLRHHRLLELFLVEELGMSWDQVDAEAEALEHALSEQLEERIAERLGHPRVDPHGDPIPSVALQVEEGGRRVWRRLSRGSAGCSRVSLILIRPCFAFWPGGGLRPAIGSRWSTSSRSMVRCSCALPARLKYLVVTWLERCACSWIRRREVWF